MADALIKIFYQISAFFNALKRHWQWLCLLLVLLSTQLALNLYVGELKTLAEWDWVDIVGEGLSALLVFCWLLLILSVRMKGRVTSLFASGLIMLDLALVQDFLDEFIRLPEAIQWDSLLEASPVGLALITAAFWCWRREQQTTNLYLGKRQHIFAQPVSLNKSLHLPDLAYLKQALTKRSTNVACWQQTALLLVEVTSFNHWVHQYAAKQADACLLKASELLLLSVRPDDLLCHYAGARFAVLVNNVSAQQADYLAQALQQNLNAFSLPLANGEQRCQLSVAIGLGMSCANGSPTSMVQTLLTQALDDLAETKQANE
ncbi:diguanylate cyclase domain-containing protein [Agarivorans sp. MS3-6]